MKIFKLSIVSYLSNYGTDQTDDLRIKRDIRILTTGLVIGVLDAGIFAPSFGILQETEICIFTFI